MIRFSSVGDIVLTSPVVRFLRGQFPGAQIDFLTKRQYADLVRWNTDLSNIILLGEGGPDELKALRRRIRETRYDLIVDLHNSLRSIYLRTLAGARKVRVFRKQAVRRWLLVRFKRNLYRRIRTVAERYADTVRIYGNPDTRADMTVPGEVVERAAGLMHSGRFTPQDRIVGFAPSARHYTKRWPMDRFVRLGMVMAAEERVRIALFGSPEEAEYLSDIAQLINSGSSSHAAESFAGRLSLDETAAALSRCALLVSNDSGLMHMAAARGVPVIGIFGSTVREFGFHPQGARSSVVENTGLSCRPCSHIGRPACPKEHFRCMQDITVDAVSTEVRKRLREAAFTSTSEDHQP